MIPWWQQLNFLIKHQLYVRILPVVVVAVIAVGLFSGRLLTSRAVNTYLEQKTEQQGAILAEVMGRIGMRALAAEAHKDENLALGEQPGNGSTLRERHLLEGFLDLGGVLGVGLVPISPTTMVDSITIMLVPDLDLPANQDLLAEWGNSQWRSCLSTDWSAMTTSISWPGGPHVAHVDKFHSLWIFQPLELVRAGETPVKAWEEEVSPEIVPLLPVIVHEERPWTDRAVIDGGRQQILLLLDVDYLVAETALATSGHGGAGLLLDTTGRLLFASVDSLRAGYDLTSEDHEVFPGVDGPTLGSFLKHPSGDQAHVYLGRKWNPYVFILAQRPELPLLVVSAMPFSQIHGGIILYTVIVVLMAVIALLGSVLAITSVGEVLSGRMQAMAVNMEEVAKGDYTRRMSVGKEDEVGRLVRYFNLMTAALDEAHTELREKTQRLRIALARMTRLDKAKDDFLALISHEVRTPLTSIMGGVEFIKMVLPTLSEEQRKLLEQINLIEITQIIESSGHRLSEFMNDAIMMTSLQSSDRKVDFLPVPINDMCELVLSGLQDAIASKRLTITNELADDDSWCVLCSRNLMITALDKLLRNAVQHNHEGGQVRITEVNEIVGMSGAEELLCEKSQHELVQQPAFASWQDKGIRWRILLIYNSGETIPEEKRESLFRKFEMVGHIEHHQKGSGLSLPIVQAVMENHGGKIFVQSIKNDGNYFYLLLPTLDLVPGRGNGSDSGEQQRYGVGGTPRHEEVHLVGDRAGFDVEFEHTRS